MNSNQTVNPEVDNNWYLQGRIIPPSCTNGDGCILHLQTRASSWASKHFHKGRVPITAEAGLEFSMSLLMPVEPELIQDSLDQVEVENDIDYLLMVKLSQPEDAISFTTLNGLTIIIHNPGLSKLFGASEKCQDCKGQASIVTPVIIEDFALDSLMQLVGDERNH